MASPSRVAVVVSIVAAALYGVLLGVMKEVPRYDCILFIGVAVAIFELLDRATPRGRTIGLYAVSLTLCASYLVHLWTLGYEGRNAIFGGILPWSDSFDFYDDALRLVHGDRFTEISSKRPFYTSALAVLLKASGGSLRFSLAFTAVTGAVACTLAALEVWKTHGARAAFVVWLILLFFLRRWTGFVQTEHVGLPLGALAFTLVWRANALREADPAHARRLVLAALFSMGLGLMARAGAFFVVPAIGFWGARSLLPKTDRIGRVRFLALGAGAFLLAVLCHRALLSMTGEGVTFSDYPGIFYGLMHGEDYTYLVQQHPELGHMAVAERVPAAWGIVASEIRATPSLLFLGFLQSGAGLFTSPHGMLSYVWTNPDDHVLEKGDVVRAAIAQDGWLGPLLLWKRTLGTYSLLNAGAMGLLGGSFVLSVIASIYVVFVRGRRDASLSLQRWSIAGVLVSAPFTPPWITSGVQVQTVTLAFVASLPAVALLARAVASDRSRRPSSALLRREPLLFAPAAFVALLFALVAWVRATPLEVAACAPGQTHVVRPFFGTAVEVVDDRRVAVREKATADLDYSIRFLSKHNPELTDSLVPYMHPPTLYVSAFDACDHRAKILVDDRRALAPGSAFRAIDAAPLATAKVLRVAPPVSAQRPVEP